MLEVVTLGDPVLSRQSEPITDVDEDLQNLIDEMFTSMHQGKGIGTIIMENILPRISHCNVILYASPGKEGFYQKLGLRKMKTGMALFKNSQAKREAGFTE